MPTVEAPSAERLDPIEHLKRASLALRGRLPSAVDLERVSADPDVLPEIVDVYLESEDFGTIIRDMHAELFLTRADIEEQLPLLGPMVDYTTEQIHEATSEEALRLVEHVVTHDRPYSEILTADYAMTNHTLSVIYGLEYDDGGPEWQVTEYTDGRPHAGVLTSTEIFRRHESAGSNFHRGRANFFADAFLCEPFDKREIVVDGGIDLSDDEAVANAVQLNENCVGCHQAMDPIAVLFFGFKQQLRRDTVNHGYIEDCRWNESEGGIPEFEEYSVSDLCYPLRMYTAGNESDWVDLGLRPPGYFGQPVSDIPELGRMMADDPRFAQCASKRFYSWFTQMGHEDVPLEVAAGLHEQFVASGYDAKALARAVVLSEGFSALHSGAEGAAPLQLVRPAAYANIIEDLTGFHWMAEPSPQCGDDDVCWTEVDLARSDLMGYRSMAGGLDYLQIVRPTHSSTPVRILVQQRHSTEAAGFVVDADFDIVYRSDRRLLTKVDERDVGEAAVRDQIVVLYAKILAMDVPADHLEIDETYGLWLQAYQLSDSRDAWKAVVSLMLQDPRLTHY